MNKGYPIYSRGSTELGDNNDRDDLRQARWNLFSTLNRHLPRDEMIKRFKERFHYD